VRGLHELYCPVCGKLVTEYRVTYGYAECPQGCGNPVNTPCTDVATFSPCGCVLAGQVSISAWERGS
jgi:hypothetical protein